MSGWLIAGIVWFGLSLITAGFWSLFFGMVKRKEATWKSTN